MTDAELSPPEAGRDAPAPRPRAPMRRVLAEALVVAVANLALFFALAGLKPADLRVPLSYDGDTLHYMAVMQGTVETGWYLHNPRLGAPFATVHHDFPVPDAGALAVVKFLGLFTADPVLLVNLLFAGGFLLVPLSAYAAARMLGIAAPIAAAVATAFNLLPFHFLRLGHLFYTLYFTIPVYVYLALRLMEGASALGDRRRLLARIVAVAVSATFGLYYAVFAFALFAFAAAITWRRSPRAAAEALLLGACAIATLALCLAPNIAHRATHGPNPESAVRYPAESEIYALRSTLLLLPPPGHRVEAFGKLGERYRGSAPLVNENATSWLGTAGAAGFVIALLAVFGVAFRGGPWTRIEAASKATLFLFLFGTAGGIGALFNYVVWAQIRAYNRVSVFIAFLALLVAAFAAMELARRIRPRGEGGMWLAGAILLLAVVLDEAPARGAFGPAIHHNRLKHAEHARVFSSLESSLAPGAMVFQLPQQRFPEGPPIHLAGSYDGFYPYFHTSSLRLSFGAMKGRAEGNWQAQTAAKPPRELVDTLGQRGFSAILVDRNGYPDTGLALREELLRAGAVPLLESGGYFAFRLVPAQPARDSGG